MTLDNEFDGRVAAVTGAARGIGAATARLLAARGAAVAILDRNLPAAQGVADAIAADGGQAIALVADVTDEQAVAAAFANVASELGGVDILVVNHTLHPCGPVLDTEPFEWRLSIDTNLGGAYLCIRAALPSMIERGGGVVIGLGSDCVVRSCRDAAAYVASKAGIVGLIRSVAIDYAAQGIRANVVTPGVTNTPGMHEVYTNGRDLEESVARAAAQSPLGRIGEPADVAEMIAFACSDRARFVTGAELLVEGGMTLTYAAD